MLLKQIGLTNGDKHLCGNIPNMKMGEYRYYPQDNPNLIRVPKNLTRKAFIRLLNKYFPKYCCSPDIEEVDDSEVKYYIGCIGQYIESSNEKHFIPHIIDKGYICFKEATKEEDGTVLNLHNGAVLVFKEKYKG